jgi:ABC-type molybdate transport system permease subunit
VAADLFFSLAVHAGRDPARHRARAVDAAQGWKSSAVLVLVALPLLIPWNVVGTIWQIFGRADIGLLGYFAAMLGMDYNYTGNPVDAWVDGARDGRLALDQRWSRCCAMPACVDPRRLLPGRAASTAPRKWAVFRYIQLPKMRGVLMIAVLLRFMDSFMIYTEPFVLTGGGPGNATTFLSRTSPKAVGQFDLGPAAAFSLIYFLIILLFCASCSTTGCRPGHVRRRSRVKDAFFAEPPQEQMMLMRDGAQRQGGSMDKRRPRRGIAVPRLLYLIFAAVADLLDRQHELQDQPGDPLDVHALAAELHLGQLPAHLHRPVLVLGLHQQPDLRGDQHRDLARRGAAGGLRVLALPLPRRQARVLLAADEPHDAAGGVRCCRSSSSTRRSA